ncbi:MULTISPECIES: glutamate-1-semialdehyde 2,1-aminomutase [Dyadobacter]|uniref:Glutamate-1-semialdehyde 2,1-aminomutase n=1 Tax=Dyadobacter chenhuakuii TaxID=2909339 RepID=A0ABY4XQ04_9BACT|nr:MULTISPECIES: glutamate-1-semialdehyde 2,1-aminomutase [Dyadobacter]MCF2493237.1 glutamate-1-semialdehyde 2,1-aminomutase [Dyadobacter chenhuakuii]MCF2517378.1 glutamate-1-semialdehyde 2,1-aminomutase [Dyadobacter sp. CY351]USJ32480.1 glutamate-1-semialdehyde 2,1-aminomutase [Dyadobacter chenhuakuii]
MNIATSQHLFEKAQHFIPGGVNSPVRAFRAVGGSPVFIKSAKGPYVYDEDDNEYIELINSWGPMILGHANELIQKAVYDAIQHSFSFGAPTRREVEMAELIVSMVPSIEKVRMVNSGTEATMSAIRVARGFTGRDKIIKFEGCYHGHGDSFLIAAGSGAVTFGTPDSPGVTKGVANDTLTAPFNDLEAVQTLVNANKNAIAALILEPVVGNMGCVLPAEGFLQGLRTICDEEGIVLILDEVMTGFRLAKGGAQERFGITPDLTTLGKIIGGGMPVGAYGGRADIMNKVSPAGPVYQAGTLSGNPIAMAAGLTMLNYLNDHPEVYTQLEASGEKLSTGFKASMQKLGLNYTLNHIGSMYTLFFTDQPVTDFPSAKSSDLPLFGRYFHAMLDRGIYMGPSQFESMFLSTALEDKHLDKIITANEESLKEILDL